MRMSIETCRQSADTSDRLRPKEGFEGCETGEQVEVPERNVLAEIEDLAIVERIEIFELFEHSLHIRRERVEGRGDAGSLEEDGFGVSREQLIEGEVKVLGYFLEFSEGYRFLAADAAIDAIGTEVEKGAEFVGE